MEKTVLVGVPAVGEVATGLDEPLGDARDLHGDIRHSAAKE